VAVTKIALKTGEDFSEENLSFEKRELTPFIQKGYFTDIDKIKGLKAMGFVRAGSVVTSMQTQKSWDIQQGQNVELTHQKGVLVVSAKVRSLENGRTNDWIRVENPDSHKIIKVRVNGPGLASTR
jgi:flagella basal body P-ring formation protein FlgA